MARRDSSGVVHGGLQEKGGGGEGNISSFKYHTTVCARERGWGYGTGWHGDEGNGVQEGGGECSPPNTLSSHVMDGVRLPGLVVPSIPPLRTSNHGSIRCACVCEGTPECN